MSPGDRDLTSICGSAPQRGETLKDSFKERKKERKRETLALASFNASKGSNPPNRQGFWGRRMMDATTLTAIAAVLAAIAALLRELRLLRSKR